MNWLLTRLSEASTYAGLAGVISGVGLLAHINEAPAIAQAVTAAAPSLTTGQWYVGVGSLIAGLVAAFKKG